MPFRESNRVEECIALFRDYDSGLFTVDELCAGRGISRQTFYVLKRRRDSGDARWFEMRSRAPKSCPHATPADLCGRIFETRFEGAGEAGYPRKCARSVVPEYRFLKRPRRCSSGTMWSTNSSIAPGL